MGKSIKKSVKYLIIFLGIVIMFPTLLYLVLQIPAVQTSIVKRITGYISREFQSSISIGRVEYRFFNKLVISEMLFKDMNNDTLLFTEKLTAGIRKLDFRNRSFGLGSVSLSEPVFALITDTAGQSNLSWYLKQLRTTADSSKRSFMFTIDRINLDDARFRYVNLEKEKQNGTTKVDFARLYLSEVNGIVENLSIHDDTTSFNVHDLSFTEKSGFDVIKMNSNISLSGSNILFESLNILTDSSILNFKRIAISADTSTAFRNFADEVRLDIMIEKSLVSSADLAYFLNLPEDLNESLNLTGKFSGTVSELRGRDVIIAYGNGTMLDCDFDLSGLPDIGNTFIYIGVNDLKTNVSDIEKLNIPGRKKFVVPEVIHRLGDLTFSGSFTGFTTDFVTYGELRTSKGIIKTDISLRPEKSDRYRIRGLVSGNNLNLGDLSGSEKLGNLSIQANVDGYASSLKEFAGNLTGKIDSIEINDYRYRNIALNGKFTEKTWDGSINMVDENISLDLLGMFNFNDTLPEFDFTLNLAKADLYRLKFDKADSTSALSMILTTNFRGTNIDNLDGEIKLLSSNITKHGKTIELYDFSIRTFAENNMPVLSLRTDFVNVDIRGNYNFAGLKHLVNTTLSSLMPSLFNAETKSKETERNNFTFDINFRNTDRINDFFRTGLLLAEKSYIKGSVLPNAEINIEGLTPSASIKNVVFENLSFLINTSDSVLNTDITVSSLLLPGDTKLGNFSIGMETKPDKFTITTDWDNKEDERNEGSLIFRGSISENNLGMPVLRIDIDSTHVYAGNNLWKISQSAIVADSNAILIQNIHIGSNGRFYHVDGAVSKNTADTLYLQFSGIDISPLNYLVNKSSGKDTARIQMDIRGQLNGSIALTNIYENLMLESDIVVSDFSILGSAYGDISVNSAFDYTKRVVDINAGNDLGGTRMFDVNGYYDPSKKSVFIDILASKLPLEALNPLLKSFASEISGFATGKLKLTGRTDNMVLKGSVFAEKATMKIDYLQTKYTITDSIRFDKNGFIFNNVKFSDTEGRQSAISGTVYHKNFRNYTADLTINMGNDFLVMNTQLKDNPSFYGKLYASGVTKIKTSPELLSFDISARTGRNSKFFIPLTDELSVSDYSFITFIDSAGKADSRKLKTPPPASKQLGFNLNIDLTVTSDAVAQIIFDETVGDMMTGSGSGILNISLDPKGNLEITGDYTIEQGDYLFTLGNILNKQFAIENGGRIMFNGDLNDAEIDLKAIYNGNVRASLFPVLQDQRYSETRYSVEPQLILSGKLFNPNVDFAIEIPYADEEAKALLKTSIASEEELSRQFMYLLVIGEFYSEQSSSSGYSSPSGTTTMAATTFEMLSNQLSNWISQISNDFDLGFGFRPGSGNKDLDPDEVQIAFETQVLDDRVIINGNFDYRTTSGSTDQLTGDFEAELKLTEKLRFKVFNRFNDTYSGRGPYTQGVGIFFREDFEKLTDLFKKRTRPDIKKEEEITLKDQ